jgi:glycosyltransferase involved in cell wall biosynthesis
MNKEKRILFLSHHAELGGGEMDLLGIINNVNKDRFSLIINIGCEGPLKRKLDNLGMQVETLDLPKYFRVLKRDPSRTNGLISIMRTGLVISRLIKHLNSTIKMHNIDIVYANTVKSACIGVSAAKRTGIKSVWRIHDCLTENFYRKYFLWFIKWVTKDTDAVICTSNAVKREYLNLAGQDKAQKVNVVPNGVDLDKFKPDRVNEVLRNNLVGEAEHIISLVGRLEPWKGQEVFVRAAQIASSVDRQQRPPRNNYIEKPILKFLIIGGPLFGREKYEDKLKKLIKKLKLEKIVIMLGHRDDVPDIMAISDIIIHASCLPEPFGRDIIEAMACGKPIISTSIGGPKEIIAPNTGILIEPNRPDILADEIMRLLGDPEGMKKMGRNARIRAEELYGIKKVTKKIEEILLGVKRGR